MTFVSILIFNHAAFSANDKKSFSSFNKDIFEAQLFLVVNFMSRLA